MADRISPIISGIFAYLPGCRPSGIPDGRIFQGPRNPGPDRKAGRSIDASYRKLSGYVGVFCGIEALGGACVCVICSQAGVVIGIVVISQSAAMARDVHRFWWDVSPGIANSRF
jgi:hypothetical protein